MGVTRRSLLGALTAAGTARGRPQPLNFLFILADDHAAYVMGCDGNQEARTPNLDRLASQSVRFARHYCNSPVCTPSRQCLLTGQLPHAAGVTRLPTALELDKPTIAKQLRRAGYQTAVFGKMHFNRPSAPGMFGFETMMTEQDVARAWETQVQPRAVPKEIRTKPVWRPFVDPARIWLNADKLPYPRYADDMKGAFLARRAIEYLEQHRAASRPIALWVSFMEPHSPYDFPVEDRTRFDPSAFDVPRVGPEDYRQIPLIFRDLTDQDKRGIAASYYTSVRFLDANIGHVLDRLRELRLDQTTLVVYTADHGYDLGQHGRFEKHCGYDPAMRVPLMMRLPGRVRPGVVEDMSEHVDVAPTILDLLGTDPLPVVHGRSLRPYLAGRRPDFPRDHIFSEYLENEEAYVRTAGYKLSYCTGRRERQDGYKTDQPTPGPYRRLYDLKQDSGEFTDVSRQRPDVVTRLEGLMLERFRATHPEAAREPKESSLERALDWYLRPRDV
jgi:choline-sulfatase